MKTKTKTRTGVTKMVECCFCGAIEKYGHSAEPVMRGRCCDTCNNTIVLMARFGLPNQFMDTAKKGKQR